MSTFSKRLTGLREERGWSKTYVAKKVGLKSMQTYANWEYGRTEPDFDMLKRLSGVFGVSTDYLVDNSSDETERDKTADLLAAHIDDEATEKDIEDIISYIEFKKSQKK